MGSIAGYGVQLEERETRIHSVICNAYGREKTVEVA